MAEKKIYNAQDSMDINELMSLNDDISPELIEQLQQQLSANVESFHFDSESNPQPEFNENDDTTLFEEPAPAEPETQQIKASEEEVADSRYAIPTTEDQIFADLVPTPEEIAKYSAPAVHASASNVSINLDDPFSQKFQHKDEPAPSQVEEDDEKTENAFGGISEKSMTKDAKSYNKSLDYLDNNVKYSKYVIYIDPENVNFIEGLTVKERKNLINKILREQDDIVVTKQRFRKLEAVIKHVIVAILTVAISVPVIYYAINASLEASIVNYRRSQSNFQTLYKENGKITKVK